MVYELVIPPSHSIELTKVKDGLAQESSGNTC